MIRIDSLDDPRVSVFRDVRDRDLRGGHGGLFMAESERVIRRLLRSPLPVHSILLTPVRYQSMRDVLDSMADAAPVYLAEPELMRRIVGFDMHRGALAAGVRPADLTIDAALGELRDAGRCRLLLACGITNVDNMGALFRNAACFGVDGVFLDPTCCDPLYRKSVRVSMGHVLTMPYAVSGDWPADLRRLRESWALRLFAAEATDGALPVTQMPRPDRLGLIFGSEDGGLPPETRSACDGVYEIPMAPGAESLNVAVSSALFLYELERRG